MTVFPYALLPSEQVNSRTRDIDLLPTEALLQRINAEDALVPEAVEKAIPQIAVVVEKIVDAFLHGGRLFYFGAGTSGRLCVLDAAECPPTFGVDCSMVQAFIAGGDEALRNAVEGAEDSVENGRRDFYQSKAQAGDVVVGVSASGSAAYLIGALEAAKEQGCFTAAITGNPDCKLAEMVDQSIILDVGPEVITGSTRLKAGTAQKLALNMLTTASMIQTGKTYENLMVDVQPTNQKLRDRARRIVTAIAEVSEDEAEDALELCGYKVKTAVIMLCLGITMGEADDLLRESSGKLRLVIS